MGAEKDPQEQLLLAEAWSSDVERALKNHLLFLGGP